MATESQTNMIKQAIIDIKANLDKENQANISNDVSNILERIRNTATEEGIPIVSPIVAQLLTVICRIVKPKRILEIGTAVGFSSILMSQYLGNDGLIDTIERNHLMVNKARKNIKIARMEKVINVLAGEAIDVLDCLDKQYDLIFLDAAKGQYIEFLNNCIRLLKPEGVLISDNVLYRGMIYGKNIKIPKRERTIVNNLREFLNVISNNSIFETSVINIGDGVAISCKIS